jgi:DNA-binding NtrC family response regulator
MIRHPKALCREAGVRRRLDLARVLLVHGDLAARLALKTILEAGGYRVDSAATPAEALCKLDEGEYELVLTDSAIGSRSAGRNVLAYARVKDYRPATALVTSHGVLQLRTRSAAQELAVYTENLPNLLGKVAELIAMRASRRHRPLGAAV